MRIKYECTHANVRHILVQNIIFFSGGNVVTLTLTLKCGENVGTRQGVSFASHHEIRVYRDEPAIL